MGLEEVAMCNQDEDFAEFTRQDSETQAEARRLRMSLNDYLKWKYRLCQGGQVSLAGGALEMPQKGWKSLALPDALYDRLEAKAESEKRSVSNMAAIIIERGLKN